MAKPPPETPAGPEGAARDPWSRPDIRPGSKGWFRAGRWELERERFGLDAERPTVPFRESRTLEGSVRHVLGRWGLSSDSLQATLQAEWPALVGVDVARRTRPGPVRDRELTVFVRGSVWYAELKRHGLRMIQDKVVARLGASHVNRVVLRPDPEGGVA